MKTAALVDSDTIPTIFAYAYRLSDFLTRRYHSGRTIGAVDCTHQDVTTEYDAMESLGQIAHIELRRSPLAVCRYSSIFVPEHDTCTNICINLSESGYALHRHCEMISAMKNVC